MAPQAHTEGPVFRPSLQKGDAGYATHDLNLNVGSSMRTETRLSPPVLASAGFNNQNFRVRKESDLEVSSDYVSTKFEGTLRGLILTRRLKGNVEGTEGLLYT